MSVNTLIQNICHENKIDTNIANHSMEICRNADNSSNAALQVKVSKCMYDLSEVQIR